MTAQRTAVGRGAARTPVRGLTVLYDANCPLCAFVRAWMGRQRALVPLTFVPAGSPAAVERFPTLDPAATLSEVTVVGDAGQVYTGQAAWEVCLWALAEHRPMAHRLTTSGGAAFAKGAVLAAAKYRRSQRKLPDPPPPRQPAGSWGGGPYISADGWSYDPARDWVLRQPPPPQDPDCGGSCPAPS
ncbi:thiol-disulfide oxidoreductase DCC family protein [Streptomyces sp. NPDC060194]|uniref:thiol-disulfide oxidoreductase DCC family protein n=1 Tax=Streptomyces sp. NPDC060194 TaxID=3347069 RepID=UPI003658D845